jgi:hypothetical protein
MSKKKAFKVGQVVRWASQAGGVLTRKEGTVIAIAEPQGRFKLIEKVRDRYLREAYPDKSPAMRKRYYKEYLTDWKLVTMCCKQKFDFFPFPMDKRHYFVEVPQEKGKPYLYKPRPEYLEAAP